ncbi:MAG: 23S rRNA (guanosine(2251)-2'-O)-methyltransferase RlmB [Pseudomonadota bacterium]
MAYVYGMHAVDALLRRNPKSVRVLYLQSGRRDRRMLTIETLAHEQGVTTVREEKAILAERVVGRHQGVIAELDGDGDVSDAKWDEARLLAHLEGARDSVLLLVLDGITDPHNLGACLRSADAAGVDAVIAPRDGAADITAVVSKVACGAAETVPFVRVTNLARTLQSLKRLGVWTYGADPQAEKVIYDKDLRGSVALVLGAEGRGLRRLTRETCDALVKLPMAGGVSSLNVSVAAGICLFEAVRQRVPAT